MCEWGYDHLLIGLDAFGITCLRCDLQLPLFLLLRHSSLICLELGKNAGFRFRNTCRDIFDGARLARLALFTMPDQLNVRSARAAVAHTTKYEIATIGFAWLVFFGAAAGVRYRLHSDIDVLVGSFSPRWQYRFAVFNFWLLALFFGSLCVFFIMHVADAHKSLTIALNLPRSTIYVPVCLATALMLLRHVEAWFRRGDSDAALHEANIT